MTTYTYINLTKLSKSFKNTEEVLIIRYHKNKIVNFKHKSFRIFKNIRYKNKP